MNAVWCQEKCVVRVAGVLAMVAVLLFAAGCGSGNGSSSGGGGGGGNNANFSNASLKGNYAYTVHGWSSPDGFNPAPFVEGGVFAADGNGNLTSGVDDLVIASQSVPNNPTTGTYRINDDGTGDLQIKFSNNATKTYRITLSDDSHVSMAQEDGFGTSAGTGERQDAGAINAVPSGAFVFQTHDVGASGFPNISKVGVTTWSGGNITGQGDTLIAGANATQVTITGTAQAPDSSTGRGTVTLSDANGNSDYVYYIVSGNKMKLLNTDALTAVSIGQAEKQNGGPFSSSSLNGGYVFGSSGEDFNFDEIHTVGQVTADGAGNISNDGSEDLVQSGNPVTPITVNDGSSYEVDSSGRTKMSLNLSTGLTSQKIMYLVSPSRAYFLVDDPVFVEDGTMDKQSGTFTNSSLNGQASFLMDGFDDFNLVFEDRVGTITPNGSATIKTNFVTTFFDPNNVIGGNQGHNFSGTYSVSANGRATSNFTGFTANMIFYLSSTNTGYFLQADTGIDIGGTFTNQVGP